MVMMKVRCLDSWISTLTEGKEYEVYDIHNQYYLIRDDMGRLCYEYMKNFTQAVGEPVKKFDVKFKTNWEVL